MVLLPLCDITKGMFPGGGGHYRLQNRTHRTLHGTLVNVSCASEGSTESSAPMFIIRPARGASLK